VTDVAPIITSSASINVVEGTPISTPVFEATASDVVGSAVTYSLSGTDASAFNINASTGVVTLKAMANYQTRPSYSINVIASDGTLSTFQAVTVAVTDVAPVIVSPNTATVLEGVPIGTAVYTTIASDVVGSAVIYRLSGPDASAFNINPLTGVVTVNVTLDYQTKSSYFINVIASDGTLSTSQAVTVAVTDVAPIITSSASIAVVEGIPVSIPVFTATASDVAGSAVTYSLSGPDASAFNINAATGVVTLKVVPNYQTKPSYSINLIASDGTLSTTQAVTVNVTLPAPVLILSTKLAGTNFFFQFAAANGQSYTIQQNTSVATSNWVSYTNIIGDGSTQQVRLPVTALPGQHFFRISEP
jgi:hypothetical protein